jgi:hypothetical protein
MNLELGEEESVRERKNTRHACELVFAFTRQAGILIEFYF